MYTVLFACVRNAGRSQMAAAYFNSLVDPEKARALSAGTAPAAKVHPEVIRAMAEEQIDLSHASPMFLSRELAQAVHLLVTMGCGGECPYVPNLERLDWPLDDPKSKPLEEVRRIRDEVKAQVRKLLIDRKLGRA